MRACYCFRPSAFSRRTTRDSSAPSTRSSGGLWSMGSFCATTPTASDDGLPPGEGAFLACSFWLADAYVMLGRLEDAQALFERLAWLCNDVGLLGEEYDRSLGRAVGNFPQAFSHVALVNTAFNLTRASKPAEQRANRSAAAE